MTDQTRQSIRDRYESEHTDDGHTNYGDLNPDGHGGLWAAYDAEHGEWEVYETTHAADVGFPDIDEEDSGDQYVRAANVQWRDVVTESGEWSDSMHRLVDSMHNAHAEPVGAVVDGRLTGVVAHYARDRADPYPYRDARHREDSYADVLDSIGVEPAESDNSQYD